MSRAACPACGQMGRGVEALTLCSLVDPGSLASLGALTGFSFCAGSECDVAYFADDGRVIGKGRITVRIGVKERAAPRPLCYCFGYSAEDIAAELSRDGVSRIPDIITAKCRDGLDLCEEKNPRGACCLGDVRRESKLLGARMRTVESCCSGAEESGDGSTAG